MGADATADSVRRVAAADPHWIGLARLGTLINLAPTTLLHAGPPYREPAEIPAPVRNAAAAALVFEGVAGTRDEALRMIANGMVALKPAQDQGVATPLAAVASRSMWAAIVEDKTTGTRRYSQLNEGNGLDAQRFGTDSAGVADRLRAIHGQAGRALTALFGAPIPLLPIALAGLAGGDELHGRVGIGSARLKEIGSERLGAKHPAMLYLNGTPLVFLNVWMAAVAVMLAAGEGIEGSALVTGAGGNGVEFGIRLAGAPSEWRSGPAAPPGGLGLPAIGDSALIDALGLGALALDAAPQLAADLGVSPVTLPLAGFHPGLSRAIGLDARQIATSGSLPPVCLAALDPEGQRGMIGRGLSYHPAACYAGL
jgi:hypothetical protein